MTDNLETTLNFKVDDEDFSLTRNNDKSISVLHIASEIAERTSEVGDNDEVTAREIALKILDKRSEDQAKSKSITD